MSNIEAIICFENASGAIMAEQALCAAGFAVQVMPAPASVRAGCGFCLRLAPADLKQAAAFLGESGIEAYTRQESDGIISYEKIDLLNEPHGAENAGQYAVKL